jgi:hypothetical protein
LAIQMKIASAIAPLVQPNEALAEVVPANWKQRLHALIAPQQRGEIRAARSQKRDESSHA